MNLVPREHSLCTHCTPGRRGSKGFPPITATAPGDQQCKRRGVWTWDQPLSQAQPHRSGGVAWGELLCRLGPSFLT